MKRKQSNPQALTDDEIAFLRSDRAPESVKRFVARQHESIGVRTTAFQKVAAAARAERAALMEVAALELARNTASPEPDKADRIANLEASQRQLLDELERTRRRLELETARPAMAVYGEGTER